MEEKKTTKVEVNLIDGELAFVREVVSPSSFRDSFNDGPVFKDTFMDGGQWESNFNNARADINKLRHPAVQEALKKIRDAAERALSK